MKLTNPDNERVQVQIASGDIIPYGSSVAVTKRVCHHCNTVWMNKTFESRVSYLLRRMDHGEPMTLFKKQRRDLASWAYKTMLMLECTRPGGPRITPEEFRRFRRSAEPLPGCSIVLGVTDFPVLAFHRHLVPGPRRVDDGAPLQGYGALLVAGHLFFHILGDFPVPNLHQALAPAMIGRSLEVIWPLESASMKWPPDGFHTKEAVVEAANMFGGSFKFLD